jgi:hypothetical protein
MGAVNLLGAVFIIGYENFKAPAAIQAAKFIRGHSYLQAIKFKRYYNPGTEELP